MRTRPSGNTTSTTAPGTGDLEPTSAQKDVPWLALAALAVVLALADMPANAPGIGAALLAASREPSNYGDKWLGRALYVASMRHSDSFLAAQNASAGGAASLPIALRLPENAAPDWREPAAADIAASWKDMRVP